MKLNELLKGVTLLNNIDNYIYDLPIHGLADSSQEVNEGFLFVAIKGFKEDGHKHIQHAIQQGAAAIVGEQDITDLSVPYLQVSNTRIALGVMAKNFYRDPASRKIMIGITGTNGKTTTSYLIKHLLEQNGISCSVMGTIQNIVNNASIKSANTTPSSLILEQLLALSNDEAVVMEVSSHGLTQHRIEGIEFDLCLFTNLHHEHLDYHGSMDNYFEAKSVLFDHLKPGGTAIINIDDQWGEKLNHKLLEKGVNVCSIGRRPESSLQIASIDMAHSAVHFRDPHETILLSPMAGIHNIYNSMMAYASALTLGVPKDAIHRTIANFEGVEGRFETSKTSTGAVVIVDYAHTPDAVYHCLTTAKESGAKRIVHIFGFRGDRDTTKRKEMIEITSRISDRFIITTDDLNSVSAQEMQKMSSDFVEQYGNNKGSVLMDRTVAIQQAISQSSAGDWIVITGKGHEKYSHDFQLPTDSDKETVRYSLNGSSKE
ncbi:UDP-N-acetylmuramoyl-L-alanyl-D-glutamate--2,6-diaminopimelate ligase [Metaplanococcus flavidus]|uniref:UDP-N-acetylmuramyl-tripeptide synthetase n=1 Tax=Metaplanococcus flavidus TaxID=569883 RepID=A0ABW3LAD9_9BACL